MDEAWRGENLVDLADSAQTKLWLEPGIQRLGSRLCIIFDVT
jgi:hypothetical protein